MSNKQFKVLMVGCGGVGKTTYLERHQTGEFVKKYLPTVGTNVRSLEFNTSEGKIDLNFWDCAGQEKFGSLREGYYVGADAAIIMFDVTARLTYKETKTWYQEIVRISGQIPMVLVGNKVELPDREVKPHQIQIHRELELPYYELSVRSCYNYEKPMVEILRLLTQNPDLALVEDDPVPGPEPVAVLALEPCSTCGHHSCVGHDGLFNHSLSH